MKIAPGEYGHIHNQSLSSVMPYVRVMSLSSDTSSEMVQNFSVRQVILHSLTALWVPFRYGYFTEGTCRRIVISFGIGKPNLQVISRI